MPAKQTFTDDQIEILLGVVRRAVKKAGNQGDVAKSLKITQPSLSSMLAGKWSPGITTAQHIAELEQLNLEDLLPDFKHAPASKSSAPAASALANLEKCINYHEDEDRWSTWTIAATRAGFFGEKDFSKTEWVKKLDGLEKAMQSYRKAG